MTLVAAARIWAAKNFVDDVTINHRNSSITLYKGARVVQVFQEKRRLTLLEGSKASVYDGVDLSDAPVIVARLLSSVSEGNRLSQYFDYHPYTGKFEDAVLVPEVVLTSGVVYKDAGGRRYLHSSSEGKISLLFFEELYNRNREWEILAQPELKPYQGSIQSGKTGFITDETAQKYVQSLYSLEDKDLLDGRSVPTKRVSSSVGVLKSTYKFEEVLSEKDFLYSSAQGQVTWSSLTEKYGLNPSIWQADEIRMYSMR